MAAAHLCTEPGQVVAVKHIQLALIGHPHTRVRREARACN